MRILIACKFSGAVRRAFRMHGHDAWSCDLLPAEDNSPFHLQGDVLEHLQSGWDMLIAHPPCTHLASSGARYFAVKRADGRQAQGIQFFMRFADSNIPKSCVENPIGIMSKTYRKPDQIIQPWQFGHPESKATCLWLKNLPPLVPTKVLEPEFAKNPDGSDFKDSKGKRYSSTHFYSGRMQRYSGQLLLISDARHEQRARWANQTPSGQNKLGPSPDRWKLRSITYSGIADAMAEQWGNL